MDGRAQRECRCIGSNSRATHDPVTSCPHLVIEYPVDTRAHLPILRPALWDYPRRIHYVGLGADERPIAALHPPADRPDPSLHVSVGLRVLTRGGEKCRGGASLGGSLMTASNSDQLTGD